MAMAIGATIELWAMALRSVRALKWRDADVDAGRPRSLQRRRATRGYATVCGLIATAAFAVVVSRPTLLTIARDQVFDAYQRVAPRSWNKDAGVRIVDIDDKSLDAIGQWPWPRTRLATLIARLREAGAAAVAFDVAFAERDRTSLESIADALPDVLRRQVGDLVAQTPSNDVAFGRAFATMPVVLGVILTDRARSQSLPKKFGIAEVGDLSTKRFTSFRSVIPPLADLADHAAGLGALNWVPDADLTVRRVPLLFDLKGAFVPSLALEAVRSGLAASTIILHSSDPRDGLDALRVGDLRIDTDCRADLRIHYTRHEAGRFLSAAAVLNNEVEAKDIADRIILVGSSAAGLADIRATPVDPAMPGIEIQAQAVENILAGAQLRRPEWASAAEYLVGLVGAVVLALAMPALSVVWSNLAMLGGMGVIVGASWLAFTERHFLVDPLVPSILPLTVYLVGTAWLFTQSQRDRKWIGDAFGRFVSKDVIEAISSDPSALKLGGETRDITVLFCDLQGFTGIVEGMDPASLTRFVNGFLTPMSEAVLASNGTVGKYIGDAVMAFWNAPIRDERHAANAVRAAMAMMGALPKIEGTMNYGSGGGQTGLALKCGIGIASGPCAVGNFGSEIRFEYSAMGDTVNVSARLEAATRQYGLDILVTEDTAFDCTDVEWLEVDFVRLKGKARPTRIFTPLWLEALAQESGRTIKSRHVEMLTAYRTREFELAARHALALESSVPSRLKGIYATYGRRCAQFAKTSFAPDWDGAIDLPK